jgi:hypothetical protein
VTTSPSNFPCHFRPRKLRTSRAEKHSVLLEHRFCGERRQHADHRHAGVDQHHVLVSRAVGVQLLVPAVESLEDPVHRVRRRQIHAVERHPDLEDLLARP